MFKAKFTEWQFSKVLRPPLAKKIVEKAKARGNRLTEAVVGNNIFSLSHAKEALERYEVKSGGSHVQDEMTPPNFVLRTPGNTAVPAGSMHSPAASRPAMESSSAHNAWTPSHAAGRQPPERELGGLRTDWRGMSLAQLHQLKWDAARLDAEGRTGEAEDLFASALSGFRHLLAPTHDLAVKAAYQLAAFYANHDRMADADNVLHWLSESHIRRWGADHERTLAHYLRVVLFLHAWSREEHAEVLVFRIMEALQNGDDDPASAPCIPGNGHAHVQSAAVDDLDEASVERVFIESQDESRVDAQLRIADLWVASGSSGMEDILPRLIAHCDKYPDRLSVQAVQARCRLLRFHVMRDNTEIASGVSLDARRSHSHLVSRYPVDGKVPEPVLSVARELAFLHLDNGDQRNCDRVLSWVAERLERQAGTDAIRQQPDDMAAVGFLTQAGREYQQRSGWKGAAPWIEWAYGICSRLLGPEHSRTRALETAIRHERYELLSGGLVLRLSGPGVADIAMEIV